MSPSIERSAGSELSDFDGGGHRDEKNLVEHPFGLLSERVPIDPETGREAIRIVFEQTITEDGKPYRKEWIVSGNPERGGLPRGIDNDIFTAVMTQWSRSGFRDRLISLGSSYDLLTRAGRSPNKREYQRLKQGISRIFGLEIAARKAIYDPKAGKRLDEFVFKPFESMRTQEVEEKGRVYARGFLRVSETFYHLVHDIGYTKELDIERYWRLPDPGSRRAFQYFDKHRRRAILTTDGRFRVGGYPLAWKLGLFLQSDQIRPARLRSRVNALLDELVKDGYLLGYEWRRVNRQGSEIVVEVLFAVADRDRLTDAEEEAASTIASRLNDEHSLGLHRRFVHELGIDRALHLAELALEKADKPSAYFTRLAMNEINGERREQLDLGL
jgi:hypothetical protein